LNRNSDGFDGDQAPGGARLARRGGREGFQGEVRTEDDGDARAAGWRRDGCHYPAKVVLEPGDGGRRPTAGAVEDLGRGAPLRRRFEVSIATRRMSWSLIRPARSASCCISAGRRFVRTLSWSAPSSDSILGIMLREKTRWRTASMTSCWRRDRSKSEVVSLD